MMYSFRFPVDAATLRIAFYARLPGSKAETEEVGKASSWRKTLLTESRASFGFHHSVKERVRVTSVPAGMDQTLSALSLIHGLIRAEL